MIFLLTTCFVLSENLGVELHGFDYYWRDFDGEIPKDALSGGKDINGKQVYIGQSYINEYGLFIGNLEESVKTSIVPCYGPKTADKLIKILCTQHPSNFLWFPTNHTRFHLDMINKHPIIAGYNHHKGTHGFLYVGSVTYQGHLKMCQVLSYVLENSECHFVFAEAELRVQTFDVLVYMENDNIFKKTVIPQLNL